MDFMVGVWIALLIVAVVVEALTAELVAIWFFPAAIVSMILAFCRVDIWIQIPVFLGVGLILIFATRPLCRKFLKSKEDKTNTDLLIGKECIVTEEVNNIAETGEVKLNGLRWSARAEGDGVIPKDTLVTVVRIEGVKLIVR